MCLRNTSVCLIFLAMLSQHIPNEWAKEVFSGAENRIEERVDEVLNEFLKDFKGANVTIYNFRNLYNLGLLIFAIQIDLPCINAEY